VVGITRAFASSEVDGGREDATRAEKMRGSIEWGQKGTVGGGGWDSDVEGKV